MKISKSGKSIIVEDWREKNGFPFRVKEFYDAKLAIDKLGNDFIKHDENDTIGVNTTIGVSVVTPVELLRWNFDPYRIVRDV